MVSFKMKQKAQLKGLKLSRPIEGNSISIHNFGLPRNPILKEQPQIVPNVIQGKS